MLIDTCADASRLPGPDATGFALADGACPFPVLPAYAARADLQKLGDAPLLVEDADWRQWIAQKQALLPQAVQHAPALNGERLAGLAQRIAAAMQAQLPNGPVAADGSLPWVGLPGGLPPATFLTGLALSLQEDLVLMADDGSGDLVAQWLAVCFPSGWRPAEKVGQSMFRIHAPVADNARLQQAAGGLAQAMANKGPFLRHVWTLSGSGVLQRDPDDDAWAGVGSLADLWFRCERQVTLPLGGDASLFLIRVFVVPLAVVTAIPGRLERLRQSLASMSAAMVAYKGLAPALPLFGLPLPR